MPIPLPKDYFGNYKVRIEFKDVIYHEQDFFSKLIGHGKLNPRRESVRIGWHFVLGGSYVEFSVYHEKDYKAVYTEKLMTKVEYDNMRRTYFVEMNLSLFPDCYALRKHNQTAVHNFEPIEKFITHWMEKPYHGGDPVADQDYNISFLKLD